MHDVAPAGGNQAYLRATRIECGWRDARRSLQDLIFTTVRAMLDDSGLRFADVDAVVVSAHDLVDGRSLSSMVSSPAAGAYLRDEVRLGDDGAAALAMAVTRVRAGLSRNCIVAAWGRASEGDPASIANALFDPFFTKPLGLTEIAVSALRASAALRRFSGYRVERGAAGARRAAAAPEQVGVLPAAAVPLCAAELPRWADLVAATVVTSHPTDVRVGGTGMSAEPYWLGDRDLVGLPALRVAAQRAYASSGRGPGDLDVVEVDGLTLFDEALAAEAVGIAAPGEGMSALARDQRINAAGGSAAGYCAPVMGLARAVCAAERLRARRPTGSERTLALATGSSTVAAQTQTAIVLEAA
jgi:acetyl-CoA C-acetyltransferase